MRLRPRGCMMGLTSTSSSINEFQQYQLTPVPNLFTTTGFFQLSNNSFIAHFFTQSRHIYLPIRLLIIMKLAVWPHQIAWLLPQNKIKQTLGFHLLCVLPSRMTKTFNFNEHLLGNLQRKKTAKVPRDAMMSRVSHGAYSLVGERR